MAVERKCVDLVLTANFGQKKDLADRSHPLPHSLTMLRLALALPRWPAALTASAVNAPCRRRSRLPQSRWVAAGAAAFHGDAGGAEKGQAADGADLQVDPGFHS